MTEKMEQAIKADLIAAFKTMLESNINQRISVELANGMLICMERAINEKTFINEGK